MIDNKTIGKQLAMLRAGKGLTQTELGDRLSISYQAVSKWERGETLPDISILLTLADVLETSVDNILRGGENHVSFRGKMKVSDMIEGILCLKKAGELLGKNNKIYLSAIQGINENLNVAFEEAFTDDFVFEAFVAEAIIQNLMAGMYVDITDVKRNFKQEHFRNIVCEYAQKYSII